VVEDDTEVGEVGLLAEHVEEAGQVPVVGDFVGGTEALGELLVGDGVAEVLDGLEAGEVLRLAPGEEGFGGVDWFQGAGPSP
jgi:hypothetical protein